MEEKVRVHVQIQAKHILHFQMYHTYISATGVIMMFLAVLSLYGLVEGPKNQNPGIVAMFVFLMLWVIVFVPANLLLKSMKQAKTVELFKNPMDFEVSAKGIGIYQNEKSGECEWKEITKVVLHKEVAIFYMGKVRANLLPLDQIPEEREKIFAIVKKYAKGRIVGVAR